MTLEPYQQKAVDWLLNNPRGIVVAPAGSGKTIIAAAALDQWREHQFGRDSKLRVGWVCNTIEQGQQAQKALDEFPDIALEMEVRIHCAQAEMSWNDVDLLIVDECHHAPAECWLKQIRSSLGGRWGFTATPFGDDPQRNASLLSLFDNHYMVIPRKEVSSRISKAKVIMLDATDPDLQEPMDREIERLYEWRLRFWKGTDWELRAAVSWQVCIKHGIINNRLRNIAVLDIASKHASDSVLVLVNEIEHGEFLAKSIPGSKLCFSKMGAKNRREALASFKSGECRCLVATSLADEGLDVPIANVLILVSGGRSSAKTEQRTGRVLRKFQGKEHGLIYDFIDRQHSMMANHSRKRVQTYRQLGYEVILP